MMRALDLVLVILFCFGFALSGVNYNQDNMNKAIYWMIYSLIFVILACMSTITTLIS